VLLTIALVGGAFLRFYRLGSRPFTVPEIQEIVNARTDAWLDLLREAGTDPIGFTWHHLVWLAGLPPDPWLERAPAALCGVATIAVVFLLGRRLFSPIVGAGASALVAFSFFHTYHSQDARSLSYVALGATLAWLAAIRFFFDGRRKWYPVFLAGAALLALSHAFGFVEFALLCGTFFMIFLFRPSYSALRASKDKSTIGPANLRSFLLALLPAVAIASLELFAAVEFWPIRGTDMGAPPNYMTNMQKLGLVPLLVTYLSGATGLWTFPVILTVLLGAYRCFGKEKLATTAALLWFIVPATFLPLAKLSGQLQRLDFYHLLFVLPPFTVFFSAGLMVLVSLAMRRLKRLRKETWRPVVTAALTLVVAVTANGSELWRFAHRDTMLFLGNDFASVGKAIEQQRVGPDDVLAFDYSIEFIGTNFYLGRLFHDKTGVTPETPGPGMHILDQMFHSTDEIYSGDVPLMQSERVKTLAEFGSDPSPYTGTIWVVLPQDEMLGDLEGLTAYSRWFSAREIYVYRTPLTDSAVPDGFAVRRFPGAVLLWKRFDSASRRELAAALGPFLIDHAPRMGHAFFPIFRKGPHNDRPED